MSIRSNSIYTISFTFLLLLIFNLFYAKPLPYYKILKVENADEFYIDLNKNNKIDENELIKLYDISAFHNKPTKYTYLQAKKLKLKQTEILALGVIAKEFAQKEFSGKKVQIEFFDIEATKNEKFLSAKLYLNKKDIGEILLNNGLATPIKKEKEYKNKFNFINFEKLLRKIKQENIVILDKNTVHNINCPHIQMSNKTFAIKFKDVFIDATKCKHCNKEITNNTIKPINIKEENQNDFKLKDFDFNSGVLTFYFTDFNKSLKPDKNCTSNACKALLNEIENAKASIDFAIYGISQQPKIIEALLKASNRGVKIRWVTDSDIKGENIYNEISTIQKLLPDYKTDNHIYPLTNEINSKYTNTIMHNKFFIFDDKITWIGSSNLSQTDLADFNANINILAKSSQITQIYKKEFEQMYNNKFHELKIKIPNKEKLKIDNHNVVSVYFSPKDTIITEKIIPQINNAQKYIYISSFIITHKKIENALIGAKLRGIEIKIITDATSANGKYSIHNSLRNYEIPVKIENKAGKMHSKTIVIDDKIVFVGSMNLTKNGENKNDENVLLIENPNVAKTFKEQFLYLYSSIPNIYLTKTPRAEGWESIGSCEDGIDNNFNGLIDKEDIGCK